MQNWSKYGTKTQEFYDNFSTLTLEQIEGKILDYFKTQKCMFCGLKLTEVKVKQIPYLEYLIYCYDCSRCKTPLMKLYSKEGQVLSVTGTPQGRSSYDIVYMISHGLRSISGSPIPTSKDYAEKKRRGRSRKYDYREVDRHIWEFLRRSYLTKFGYDTESVWRKVNERHKKSYSRTLVVNRLEDLVLRGLLTKERRRYGNVWKSFWKRANWVYLPHSYYIYPNREKFEDRELFPLFLT